MVVSQDTFNNQAFIKSFEKRFLSFCDKSPLFLKFKIINNGVIVYNFSREVNTENPYTFIFDYSLDDKNNIKKIKDYLVNNCYPVFTIETTKTRKLDAFEIQDKMVNEKISFTEASNLIIIDKKILKFRLEKVLNAVNSIIVRNLDNNRLYLYKAHKPVIAFTNYVFNDIEKAKEFFISQCEFEHPVQDSMA
jgi:hypothetical protein